MTDDDSTTTEKVESLVERLYQHYKYAGAPSEGSYDFNGGFSYHAEAHAFGVGFGVGITAGATGNYKFAGAIVALAFGIDRGVSLTDTKIGEDIKQEPHYALMGVGVGILLGNPQRAFDGVSAAF